MSQMLLVGNPRKKARKKASKKKTRSRPRKSAAKPRRRPRKRNPRMTGAKIQRQVTTATTGALGALGLDIALAYIPLPAAFSTGITGKVAKGVAAIALGVVANMAGVKAENANRMAEGALTVQIHGIGKELLTQFAPAIALSAYLDDNGMGYYGSGWNPNAIEDDYNNNNNMGAYLPEYAAENMSLDEGGFAMYEEGEDAGFGDW